MMDIRQKIDSIIASPERRLFLKEQLQNIQDKNDLINFLNRFILFNSWFAVCIPRLATEFNLQRKLFLEPQETITYCADRSDEVASYIFSCAIDEYVLGKSHITHRYLSQSLLKEVINFFEIEVDEFNQNFSINFATKKAIDKIIYGFEQARESEKNLFLALGFHIAQEMLGSEEYQIVDEYLRLNFIELVEHLKNAKATPHQNAYFWLLIHISVENNHAADSIICAEKCIEYYSGKYSKEEVASFIMQGIQSFADLQNYFFNHVLDDYHSITGNINYECQLTKLQHSG